MNSKQKHYQPFWDISKYPNGDEPIFFEYDPNEKKKNSDPEPMDYSGIEGRANIREIIGAFILGGVIFLAILAAISAFYDFSVQQSNKSYCIDEYSETVISNVPAYCIEYFLRGN